MGAELSPDQLHQLSAGDPVVRRALTDLGRLLGADVADVGNSLNPQAVVLGGWICRSAGPVLAGIRESLERRAHPGIAETMQLIPGAGGRRGHHGCAHPGGPVGAAASSAVGRDPGGRHRRPGLTPDAGRGATGRVLALIPPDSTRSVGELIRVSGLSRPIVTDALHRLQDDGVLVWESGPPAGRGRPPRLWRRRPPPGLFAALALSRDAISVRVADGAGTRVAERQGPFDVPLDGAGAVEHGSALIRECLAVLDAQAGDLSRVVLGVPCPLDLRLDRLNARGILPGWIGFHPADRLRSCLAGSCTEVILENDANLAAVGELVNGAGAGAGSLVHVKLAPGLGSGLIVGGRLYRGAAGLAGEIGHVQVSELGYPCVCGARGCLGAEIYTAACDVAGTGSTADVLAELSSRCNHGDEPARRILGHIGTLVGDQLGVLATVLDLERVIISAGTVPPHPALLAGARAGIARTPMPPVAAVEVVAGVLGAQAEAVGGVALAAGAVGAGS